jgi:hypothetical protein
MIVRVKNKEDLLKVDLNEGENPGFIPNMEQYCGKLIDVTQDNHLWDGNAYRQTKEVINWTWHKEWLIFDIEDLEYNKDVIEILQLLLEEELKYEKNNF